MKKQVLTMVLAALTMTAGAQEKSAKWYDNFKFSTLTVGNVKHTFRLPYLSATHLLHSFREDDFVTGLRHELDNLVNQGMLHLRLLRQSHCLVDTTGEVDNLQCTIAC